VRRLSLFFALFCILVCCSSEDSTLQTSAWERQQWRGIVPYTTRGTVIGYVGTIESHEVASNFDALIDLSGASIDGVPLTTIGAEVFAAIYATQGSQKVYVSQWVFHFGPTPALSGPPETGAFPPLSANFPAALLGGNGGSARSTLLSGIIQGGGLVSSCWGLELGLPIANLNQLQNVFVGTIAHGMEVVNP
jgi:hypothetical protein